jgi:hypothetical protein
MVNTFYGELNCIINIVVENTNVIPVSSEENKHST